MSAWTGRALPLLLLLAWEALCRLGAIDARFVPAPSAILACLASPDAAADLLRQSGCTLRRGLGGFLLGGGLGYGFGLACGVLRRFEATVSPLVAILRPVPSVAVIPAAMLLLGLGDGLHVTVAAFACCWPVFTAVRDAVHAVDPIRCDTARVHGLSGGAQLLRVVLPASLPGAVTGLRTALGIAVAVAVGSEMVAASNGLGNLAITASFAQRLPLAWAAMLAMGLVGGVCALGFSGLARLLERWRPGLLGLPERQERQP